MNLIGLLPVFCSRFTSALRWIVVLLATWMICRTLCGCFDTLIEELTVFVSLIFCLFLSGRRSFIDRVIGLFVSVVWFCFDKEYIDYLVSRNTLHKNCVIRKNLLTKLSVIPENLPSKNHSHYFAATLRNSVSHYIDNIASQYGFNVFVVSKAKRDEDNRGTRGYYTLRDLPVRFDNHEPRSGDLIKIIDADYYEDMPNLLNTGCPIMMYTFVPTSVGGSGADAIFSVTDDVIQFNVVGDAEYKHELWNYSSDFMSSSGFWETIVYSVEQRVMSGDANRRIILLRPETVTPFPFNCFIPKRPLERMRLSYDGYNMLSYIRVVDNVARKFISLSLPGRAYSITIPEATFDNLRTRFADIKQRTQSTIETILRIDNTIAEINASVTILMQVLLREEFMPHLVTQPKGIDLRPANYEVVGPVLYQDPKPIGRIVGPCLTSDSAPVPARSLNNDIACVEGRITNVLNDVEPSLTIQTYAMEFLNKLIPDVSYGRPHTHEYVVSLQKRPQQRSRIERVLSWLPGYGMVVKAFQKAECYMKYTHPRNISTTPTEHLINLSRYTYAFKEDVLSKQDWYVPKLTPHSIAQKISHLASDNDQLVEGDYSRFDGTISVWLRKNVEFAAYHRWVNPADSSELHDLMYEEINANARTREGFRYNTLGTRLSGSPLTTDGNCLINAFVVFVAQRLSGLSPSQSMQKIGMICGDDSVSPVHPDYLERAAKAVGLTLKAKVVPKGQPITFLSRVFINPPSSLTSFQDPLRTIPKLHISFCPDPVPADVALRNKADGYLSTDSKTPIIGEWCRAVIRSTPAVSDRWRPELYNDEKYITGSWPQGDECMDYEVCKRLDINLSKLQEIEGALKRANSVSEIPTGILPITIPIDVPIIREGRMQLPPNLGGTDFVPVSGVAPARPPSHTQNRQLKQNSYNNARRLVTRSDVTKSSRECYDILFGEGTKNN